MKERPIIFSGEMVRAILDGRIVFNNEILIIAHHAGMTAKEIADLAGCSTWPVKKAFKKIGLHRPAAQRTGRMAGERNPAWKGGRRVRKDGYVLIWTANGERLEHRVVMERHLGRFLSDEEIVHHKDHNKANNDISNLELLSQAQHIREHLPEMHRRRYAK